MTSIKKHIPNTITSVGLACGTAGIIATLSAGRPDLGLYLMLAALLCDYCDGLAARMLGAYSDMGKELDSLADMVSFGVLPSVMLFKTYSLLHGTEGPGAWLCWAPLLLSVFSGLRLAKFNIDERQHESFIGLATPSSALLCAGFCCWALYSDCAPVSCLAASVWFIPVLSLALGLLLVSEIPMFSLKFGKNIEADTATRMKRYAFASISAIVAILIVVFGIYWSAVIVGIILTYILMNACLAIFKI